METLRNPVEVLKALSEKAVDKDYRFKRLYRNLYNPEFYLLAYKNIYANKGGMTVGSDGSTLSGMSLERIDRIIETLKDHSYIPNPARREYISKKNSDKKRPLGIPSANDKLVQEVVRMILEAIFEPNFSKYSHGFRPKKSCHTALKQLSVEFTGAKWFIEGDIKACFDSFDHHVLIGLLRRRIDDEYFISLMWKFFKAGYVDQWTYHKTYAGTPQGSGMSPILSNIYLSELDNFIEGMKEQFDCGKTIRSGSTEYNQIIHLYKKAKQNLKTNWDNMSESERATAQQEINSLKRQQLDTSFHPHFETGYKRLKYCRYADDWMIAIIGSKEDAQNIKVQIKTFLADALKLELSDEKTKITDSKQFARFLGFDIAIARNKRIVRRKDGHLSRNTDGILLYMPKEAWFNKLREYNVLKITRDKRSGKEVWKSLPRGWLVNKSHIEILSKYNSEIRGLYNYYALAINVSRLNSFYHIMKGSILKTLATKHKCKVSKILHNHMKNGEFAVKYSTKAGEKTAVLYNSGFSYNKDLSIPNAEILPQYYQYTGKNSLAYRIKLGLCEHCESQTDDIRMFQVKSLKGLKGDKPHERIMKEKRRKTLAVCRGCYSKITNGNNT